MRWRTGNHLCCLRSTNFVIHQQREVRQSSTNLSGSILFSIIRWLHSLLSHESLPCVFCFLQCPSNYKFRLFLLCSLIFYFTDFFETDLMILISYKVPSNFGCLEFKNLNFPYIMRLFHMKSSNQLLFLLLRLNSLLSHV